MKLMNEITDLLKAWSNGDKQALDKLISLVDPELKKIAHAYIRDERPGHILQTTALVNEALMKLIRKKVSYENRTHFYGFVAKRMRQVLIDYAKKESAAKRGNRAQPVDIAEARHQSSEKSQELILLDEALSRLASIDERKATIVECRHFIGLSRKEIAELLGVSQATVDREWSFARNWLKREMSGNSKK
jgi:RNA polymerase sigma-70 factor, ECF subfamily